MHFVVIGNGFDLFHKYRTSYADFRKYVLHKSYQAGIYDLSMILEAEDSNHNLWSNFEVNLADVDFRGFASEIAFDNDENISDKEEDRMYKEALYTKDDVRDSTLNFAQELNNAMNDWVLQATKDQSQKDEKAIYRAILNDADLFLTFNFSQTLTTVYGIPDNNIIHIHGIAKNRPICYDHHDPDRMGKRDNSALVIGHASRRRNEQKHEYKNVFSAIIGSDIPDDELFNSLRKETLEYHLDQILSGCSKITKLSIIGHSIGDINSIDNPDLPYFTTIMNHCCKKLECFYYKYNSEKPLENEASQIKNRLSGIFPDAIIHLMEYDCTEQMEEYL